MIKTIGLLQDSYPELNLQLAYDFTNNTIQFSGNSTPLNLRGHGIFARVTNKNININISSIYSPAISSSFLNGSNDSRLYIGGGAYNPIRFCIIATMSKTNNIIKTLFYTLNLNKQIKIL